MAFDIYIKFDGIKSDAFNSPYGIEIQSFSWGVENTASPNPGSGGGSGKASFSSFSIVKKVDKSSPVLFTTAASGKPIPSATVTLTKRNNDKGPQPFLTYKLEGILIGMLVYDAVGQAQDQPQESLSLNFQKITQSYIGQKPDGSPDTPVIGGWDIGKNKVV